MTFALDYPWLWGIRRINGSRRFVQGPREDAPYIPPAPPDPFVPTDLPNLVAWFDMQDSGSFTETGGFVTSITNKVSSVAWDTEMSVNPGYVASAINSLPAMAFNGTTQAMSSTEAAVVAAFVDSPARTCYAVFSADIATPTTFRTIFGFGNSGLAASSSGGFGQDDVGSGHWVAFHRNSANTVNNDASVGTCDTNGNIFTLINSPTTVSIRINNGAADPSAADASYGATAPNRCAIGALPRSTPTLRWDGKIGEILIYTEEHDATAQSQVCAYLGAKWAITVAP